MAESEQGKKTPTPQRRSYYQTRPNYSNRGRGRFDPHVNKALQNFGVTDLREWLDQRHQQEGQFKSGVPPPDPTYNYLKDPSRETTTDHDHERTRKYQKERAEGTGGSWTRGHTPRGSRGRGRYDRRLETDNAFIDNPVNIKVELKTATGERNCKLDEETKLTNMKHVADHIQQERRSFKGERGRGRGRDRSEHGETRIFKGDIPRGNNERYNSERGGEERGRDGSSRGRGGREERGGGGSSRGGGGRGFRRGRGQGRFNPNSSQNQQQTTANLPQTLPVAEVPTEENWDNECINPVPEVPEQTDSENIDKKREGCNENVDEERSIQEQEYYEEYEEGFHDDYEEGDEEYVEATGENYEEYTENSELSPVLIESESEIDVKLDENLTIISTVSQQDEANGKRMVRFKMDEKTETEEGLGKTHQKQPKPQENSKHKTVEEGTEDKSQASEETAEDKKTELDEGDKNATVGEKSVPTSEGPPIEPALLENANVKEIIEEKNQ